ncbi:hypothetical protein MSAN_00628900 [Mycena sanguinolenta]|uniref:Uncharacterized protein n=1 Tax=Mycena sanguinolenta TaxID=230812 RepID=A0A8H6YZN5_9AGAR|nr:hypothetical protein MSAN_00628900 [Mycena sanguinolenta]
MGGFISSMGHPIATKEQLEDPDIGSELQEAIRNVNKEDIKDKSKGDAFSKGVALLQGLWFIVQCVARAHQHLAITQLEVATLAFAVVNIFIWLLWWNKPLDVQRSIVIGRTTQPDTETITLPVQLSHLSRFWGAIFGDYLHIEHEARTLIFLGLVGTVFGGIHCAAWNTVFPTPTEMWIWRTSAVVITVYPGFTSLMPLMAATPRLDSVLGMIVFTIVLLGIPIYIAARIILIVLPLAELRFLPASAFVDVNWSTYIPHI